MTAMRTSAATAASLLLMVSFSVSQDATPTPASANIALEVTLQREQLKIQHKSIRDLRLLRIPPSPVPDFRGDNRAITLL